MLRLKIFLSFLTLLVILTSFTYIFLNKLMKNVFYNHALIRLERLRDHISSHLTDNMNDLESQIRILKEYMNDVFMEFELVYERLIEKYGREKILNLLKKYYVEKNPYSEKMRLNLISVYDIKNIDMNEVKILKEYDAIHKRIQKKIISLLKYRNYEDIILINKNGDILYTARKLDDFSRNITKGRLSTTELGRLYWKMINLNEKEKVVFSEIDAYSPNFYTPTFFIGVNLTDKTGKIIGHFVIELKVDFFNHILKNHIISNEKMSIYIVDSNQNLKFGLDNTGLMPFNLKIDTEYVRNLSSIGIGNGIFENFEGSRVLVTYTKFSYDDLNWGIVVEYDLINIRNISGKWTRKISFAVIIMEILILVILFSLMNIRFINPTVKLINLINKMDKLTHVENVEKSSLAFSELKTALNKITAHIESRIRQELDYVSKASQFISRIYELKELSKILYNNFENLKTDSFEEKKEIAEIISTINSILKDIEEGIKK